MSRMALSQPLACPQAGVERFGQAVAEEVDGEDDDHDRHAGSGADPPADGKPLTPGCEVGAPLGGRRLDAETEKVERRGDHNRPTERGGRKDRDLGPKIRENVARQQPEWTATGDACREDVLPLS